SDQPYGNHYQGELVFESMQRFAVGSPYKSPLNTDSVDSDPDVKLYHREQDEVEGKPPTGLNSCGALHCGYWQIGEHRPHVDAPHDQNYESSYRLDYPQPGIGVVKIDGVLPHRLLFTSTEGQLAGRQHKMNQHGQGYQRTADLSHVSGFEETGERVHHP